MVALNSYTSSRSRPYLYFFAGSFTVVLIYILVGQLPSRQSLTSLQPSAEIASQHEVLSPVESPHADSILAASHNAAGFAPAGTSNEDGWFISPEDNPYGKEGVDLTDVLTPEEYAASNENNEIEHIELKSQMTRDGKWFTTDFLTEETYNPGFLPHRYKPNTWIMAGMRDKSNDGDQIWNSELVCEATYHENSQTMRCTAPPTTLPITSTFSENCAGDLLYEQVGPHDPRVFYGPNAPYIMYGSQGPGVSCLGQYIHDLNRLTPLVYNQSEGWLMKPQDVPFFYPTGLQRPPPVGRIEKNWFAFWDANDEMYLHYDVKPTKRSFAKVHPDGSVGEDLFPASDVKCMKELMPAYHHNDHEWIHQATNSLSITLCKRSDPDCRVTDDNTYIMLLFQTKTVYMHGVYYPYIMLFKRSAPFEIYGISSKPFWFSGRGKANEFWRWSTWKPKDQTQLVFTTQMSWQGMGSMYHGYLDDTVMFAMGVEDKHGAGIDVKAGDLLQGMRFCSEVK